MRFRTILSVIMLEPGTGTFPATDKGGESFYSSIFDI